jgi:energy-converting hydrogenase B subunit D
VSPVLLVMGLVAVAASGSVVALTGDPARQAVTLSVHGLLLGVVFVLFAAPDVALSQLAVGSVIVPLIVMLTVRAVRNRGSDREPR